MKTTLAKQSDLKPVSFSAFKDNLTEGQKLLLAMLKKHIEEGLPITKQDILDCYVKSVSNADGTKTIRDWNFVHGEFVYFTKEVVYKDTYRARTYANQWFKNNLAACIIKGKLLVVPVIELE